MAKRKTETKYFQLFTDRCNKLGFQYFTDINREQPLVNWAPKGLTREEYLMAGSVVTVANLDDLWMHTYKAMVRWGREKQLKNKTYEQ